MDETWKLQKDIGRLGSWARKWGIRFQPVECKMMQLAKKGNKLEASYTLDADQFLRMLNASNSSV